MITSVIKIVEFELFVEIGIHDFEKNVKQRVLVDIDLEVNSDAKDDNIDTVVDYDLIHRYLTSLSDRQFNLQETLCANVVEFLFQFDAAKKVSVYVRKTDVYTDVKEVGILLIKDKNGA